MSRHHVAFTDNAELRAKIDKAKPYLPLPDLMRRLGYPEKHIGKTAHCPFHDDQHPSFSVFKGDDGFWHFKCFVCDTQGGDEITFLVKHFKISRREAIKRYLEMAGLPPRCSSKSREYPKSHVSPEFPVCPVSPVSEGQVVDGELDKQLKALGRAERLYPPMRHIIGEMLQVRPRFEISAEGSRSQIVRP